MPLSVSPDGIDDFSFDGKLPYGNRLFFIQHLMPYIFFNEHCRNKKILEIGIGEGFGTYRLSQAAETVVGLDLDATRWGSLRKYVEKYKLANVNFVNGNGLSLPFKDNSFDRVITCQVIEHIPEDKLSLFLREIQRILKPGGTSLVATLNVEKNIKDPLTYEKFYQHHHEFNGKEFKALLRTVFTKVEIFGLGIGFKHRIFLRLKKWGFLRYSVKGFNPTVSFYDHVLPRDFLVSRKVTKRSLDLIGLCYK